MIAVIFEVEPYDESRQTYFDIAAELGPLLNEVDGFISIERFVSTSNPGKILSLSFWRDETAVQAWRTVENHRVAQARGRREIFRHYRLRVASVIRDYDITARDDAPVDSRMYHG